MFLSDYLYFSRLLTTQLLTRGYSFSHLRKISHMVANLNRSKLLEYKPKISNNFFQNSVIFQSHFDKNIINSKDILKKSWNSAMSESPLKNSKIIVINRMQPNIGSILIHNFKIPSQNKFRTKICDQQDCKVCKYSSSFFYIKLDNFYLPIYNNSDCKSCQIIYIIKCDLCNCFYIGQSSKDARTRIYQHIKDINRFIPYKDPNSSSVATHFNTIGHDRLKYFKYFIFRNNLIDNERLEQEGHLINLFLFLKIKILNEIKPKMKTLSINIF